MIYDYRVISSPDKDNMEESVKDSINDGWEPLGGVSVTAIWRGDLMVPRRLYSQAMVRRGE